MPDDMLEDAISVSKKALEEHNFEEEGVEVRYFLLKPLLTREQTKTNLYFRLQESLKNIWTTAGNLTGTCS